MEQKTKKIKSPFADHKMAEWWHPTKNGNLLPSMVGRYSKMKCFFYHEECGHDYEYILDNINTCDPVCPYCNKYPKLCGDKTCLHCLKNSFASFVLKDIIWHPTLNLPVEPHMVTQGVATKYYFWHEKCNHTFMKTLNSITSGSSTGCPYCALHRHILCHNEDCISCFKNSFASINLGEITWSNEKNAPVTVRQVVKHSIVKYWFSHDTCGHLFTTTPGSLTSNPTLGCPFCRNGGRLCGDQNCKYCFDRSLASVELPYRKWNYEKNGLAQLHTIHLHTRQKFYFICSKCGHDDFTSVDCVIKSENCKYCVSKAHCGDKFCQTCKNNSILSHEMAKYLSPKNDSNVWMLPKASGKYVIFDCPYCNNEYIAQVSNVLNGSWCKCRKNKTETKLCEFLQKTFPTKVVTRDVKFEWCKSNDTGRFLPFDICFDGYIICELDGRHHFENVSYWKSNAINRQQVDIQKMHLALQNNFRIIRLFQKDVWEDKNDWEEKLVKLIQNDVLQVSFVSTDNELVTNTYVEYEKQCMNFI